jgi:hypothetical protein
VILQSFVVSPLPLYSLGNLARHDGPNRNECAATASTVTSKVSRMFQHTVLRCPGKTRRGNVWVSGWSESYVFKETFGSAGSWKIEQQGSVQSSIEEKRYCRRAEEDLDAQRKGWGRATSSVDTKSSAKAARAVSHNRAPRDKIAQAAFPSQYSQVGGDGS